MIIGNVLQLFHDFFDSKKCLFNIKSKIKNKFKVEHTRDVIM